ncbi:MAG: hypothetical protein DRJ33_01780 [Candidatus Methanomethylicota archaeon]|uniref:DUF711 domain-containing protein n=1 Tax=Thermoproteota archaeon TaxID=2056631 RepID=A0A497F155_9CREN|nr:MAG: hypothetical protein DRJ33_01780 [Candidatus Verstraetearchaeota archaeon]
MEVRALCLHYSEGDVLRHLEDLEELLKDFTSSADKALRKRGLTKPSMRLALPQLSAPHLNDIKDLAKSLQELAEKIGLDYVGGLHVNSSGLRDVGKPLLNAIVENDRVFASSYLSKLSDIPLIARFIDSLRSYAEVGASVRFVCLMYSRVETPYLPAATTLSPTHGISAAALYASDVKRAKSISRLKPKLLDIAKRIHSLAREVASSTNLKWAKVDMSLSPWANESVAEALESLAKCSLEEPGVLSCIKTLAKVIQRLEKDVALTGFNDVMLSYAEDERLMELGAADSLSISQLMLYSMACAVGIDMLPIPSTLGIKWIKNLLLDMFTISDIKKKPLGVRLLPTNAKPGDLVDIWFFKNVPIPKMK